MFEFISVLRAVAVSLITNSHFDSVYPINISWGGAPGVALFFMITGFLLVGIRVETRFTSWYVKKILRIYPSIFLANLIMIFTGFTKIVDFSEMVRRFIYPTSWWFIEALLVLYVFYFWIIKYFEARLIYIIGLLVFLYFGVYFIYLDLSIFVVETQRYFQWIYGFISMLIGAVIRKNWNENYQNKKNKYIFKDLIKCCICILGFLSVKILISRIDFIMRLQFLTQAFSVGFAYFAFKVLSAFEDFYKISKDKLWYKFISLIGALTLEIYFIQFMVISYFKDLVFPLNFLVIVFLIISLAYIINLVSSFIIRNVERVRQ